MPFYGHVQCATSLFLSFHHHPSPTFSQCPQRQRHPARPKAIPTTTSGYRRPSSEPH
ncbi:hypothetical protein PLICRDRAFT_43109 [Plicaturopsis crispa FD-325 SS-3]|nr:hypothetical protein PLICRDRAFT_43109 [Plicaturopsis crispa FD-325 SS-3]